ncbi:MAG: N-acetyltransferase family protein [Vicinamibacterales bacterium]
MPRPFRIEHATAADVPVIFGMIRALADYERLADAVTTTEEELREVLFGASPAAEVVIGYEGDAPAGIAIFFHNFSTFLGKRGLYLEDLFVKPEYRGRGYGKALLRHLAGIAVARDCGRMEWSVLDWNAPAIGFYRKLGAVPMDEWTVFRLTGEALAALGSDKG